jgi:hypothetical protein
VTFIEVAEDLTILTFLETQTWAVVREGLGVVVHLLARGMGLISSLICLIALFKDAYFVELSKALFG